MSSTPQAALARSLPAASALPGPGAASLRANGEVSGWMNGLAAPGRTARQQDDTEAVARAHLGLAAGEALSLLRAPLGAWAPLWLADQPELAAAWRQGRPCWLLAELQLQTGPASPCGVPSLAALNAWAERNGVQLGRRVDVVEALLAHRDALTQAPPQGAALPEPARQELQARAAALRSGEQGAFLLELLEGQAPPLRAVAVGPARAPAMRALFQEIFGHAMSEAHWQWKYGTGLGQAVALLNAEGELVAHYAGLSRPVWAFGERVLACQVCDVMVAPRARRSLARRGPMFNLAASFLEGQIGWGLRHCIGFGFPSARHHGAADRLGLYEAVDRVVELSWPARSGHLAARLQALPRGHLDRKAAAQVRRLWGEMASSLREQVLGERDAAWLQWRYLDRPEIEYELHWVLSPWLRRPLGLLVVRRREEALELLDLIGPSSRIALLVQAARQLAHQAGLPQLRLWITASQRARFVGADPQQAPVEKDLHIDVPACAHTPGPAPALFRERWFLMAGDADFT